MILFFFNSQKCAQFIINDQISFKNKKQFYQFNKILVNNID